MMLPAKSLVTHKAAGFVYCDFAICPPEGTYDTTLSFCDGGYHSWWGEGGLFEVSFWDAGSWGGVVWVSYDTVFCTFGGCTDLDLHYRWC